MRYRSPTTVDEAVALLGEVPDARVFAGATDLIPQMRAGRPEPEALIDLKRIPTLTALVHESDTWAIGAAVPAADIAGNEELAAALPGLAEAANLIGSDQIQTRASLGGNLCNASPAADTVPSLVVNEARAVVVSPTGERVVPVESIPAGPGSTTLAPGELVTTLLVDDPGADTADAYLRFIPRTEMDIAVVGAASRVTVDGDGAIQRIDLVLGAVAPTIVRVEGLEGVVGSTLDSDAEMAIATAATAACDPIDDKRGTAAYRRRVAGVLARRATAIAHDRAIRRGETR